MTPPRIALIHATRLSMDPIDQALQRHWPQASRMHLLDESLSVDRARDGRLTEAMVQRFETLAVYARGCGCDGVLFTCSAFGQAIEAAGRACGLPTHKPNQAMFADALSAGARVALVATFEPSVGSMRDEFTQLAPGTTLRTVHVPGAMAALARGDASAHDDAVADAVAALDDVDTVMLAQFSMARAQAAAQARTGARVLTSPQCAVLAMRAAVEGRLSAA